MSFKNIFLSTTLLAISFSSYAEETASENTGFFIGGFAGQTKSTLEGYKETVNSYGVYGGYNFTPMFGLEGSFFTTSSYSKYDSNLRAAGSGGLTFTPKITFAINDAVSLYLKAGVAALVYVEEYKYANYSNYYDRNAAWEGIGSTFGVGAEFRIVNGLKLRISYDQYRAVVADDNDYYSDLHMKLSQGSVGLHYQF